MTHSARGRAVGRLVAGVMLFGASVGRTAENSLWRNYRMEKLLPYNLVTSIAPAGDAVWFGGW